MGGDYQSYICYLERSINIVDVLRRYKSERSISPMELSSIWLLEVRKQAMSARAINCVAGRALGCVNW